MNRIKVDFDSGSFMWNLQADLRKCLLCQEGPCSKQCAYGVEPDRRIYKK